MDALSKLLLFSVLMFCLPALTYYGASEGYFDGLALRFINSEILEAQRPLSAGIVAIVSVNLVVFAYVLMAFTEKQESEKKES